MRNQKITKIIFSLLIAIFIATPLVSSALSNPYDQLKEIESKIEQNEQLADEKAAEARNLKSQISVMDGDISVTQADINSLNSEIKKQEEEITKLNGEIKESEEKIEQNKENLKKLVKILYEKGDLETLEFLASATSLSDLIDAEEYNIALQDKVNSTITETRELKAKLASQKNEQEGKKKSLEKKKAEVVAKQQQLYSQRSIKNDLLGQAQGDQAAYEKIIDQLLAQKRQVEASLWSGGDYVSYGRVNQGDVIGYIGNSGFSTGCHLHFEIRTASKQHVNPASYMGAHPAPGVAVSAPYGYSSYYFPGVFHTGIDYADGCRGTGVHATSSGDIVKRVSGRPNTYPWSYEYGNYVMIQHDNGMFSLYAHLR